MTRPEALILLTENVDETQARAIARAVRATFTRAEGEEWERLANRRRQARHYAKTSSNADVEALALEANGSPNASTGAAALVTNASLDNLALGGCAEKGERFQTSKEENPEKEKPLRGKKKDGEAVPPDPRFQPVTDGYCAAYLETFGSPYVHGGGKDGKKLKALLATANAADFPTERIVKIARTAMRRSVEPFAKATKYATSLCGFCEQFNAIRAELNQERDQRLAKPPGGYSLNAATPALDGPRASCNPAEFSRWFRSTYPRADPQTTPHTADFPIVQEFLQSRKK